VGQKVYVEKVKLFLRSGVKNLKHGFLRQERGELLDQRLELFVVPEAEKDQATEIRPHNSRDRAQLLRGNKRRNPEMSTH
jgi:hypothetical protein